MLIKIPRGWQISEREATPEHGYLNRRKFLAGASAAAMAEVGGLVFRRDGGLLLGVTAQKRKSGLLPLSVVRNPEYKVDHPVTAERVATRFNNYYEFTEIKDRVWKLAEEFEPRPWEIEIKGLVEKPRRIDVDDLVRQMPLEERVYRHRCVETWAIIVPWIGFPMRKFIEWCAPILQGPLRSHGQLLSACPGGGAAGYHLVPLALSRSPNARRSHQRASAPRRGHVREDLAQPERRAAAPACSLEIWVQEHQGHHEI